MKINAMISIIPIGAGVSLSNYIAACERVLWEAGIKQQLHAHGTNVEGEWDKVLKAVKKCVDTVHAMGAPRISTFIKISTRTDGPQSSEDMIRSVEEKLRIGVGEEL
ncbi:MAG: MTH1187 family thiamine-binding protein [Acidobacteriota bacterium]